MDAAASKTLLQRELAMKITKTQLKQIIKEEIDSALGASDLNEFFGPFKTQKQKLKADAQNAAKQCANAMLGKDNMDITSKGCKHIEHASKMNYPGARELYGKLKQAAESDPPNRQYLGDVAEQGDEFI